MRLLLDTHVLVWTQEGVERFGPKTVAELTDSAIERIVSPVSALEIARLVDVGRIELDVGTKQWLDDTITSLRCRTIEVSHGIAVEAYDLPGALHKDPADRLLVATARVHELTLLTADEQILAYPHAATRDART